MTGSYYGTPTLMYIIECAIVGLLCILRLRKLVRMIGWRGIARELRELV